MQNATLSILFYLSMYNFEVVLYFKIKIRFYRSEPSDVKYVQPTSTLVSKVATTGSGRALKVPTTVNCFTKHLASTIPKCPKLKQTAQDECASLLAEFYATLSSY